VLDGRSDDEGIRGAVVVNIVQRDAGTDERRYSDRSGDRLDLRRVSGVPRRDTRDDHAIDEKELGVGVIR